MLLPLYLLFATLFSAFGDITRGPVITLTADETYHLAWSTSLSESTQFEYGRTPLYETGSISTPTGTVHKVSLHLPSDGATIYYRIIEPGNAPVSNSFHVAPAPGQPFRFAAIGDYGTGLPSTDAVIAGIASYAPRLLITAGDNVYEAGAPYDLDPKLFVPFKSLLATMPYMPSLGNHDIAFNGGISFLSALDLPTNGPNPEHNYSYDYGNVHFVVVDSNGVRSNVERPSVLNWLDQDLATTEQPWKVVYFHHPPYTSWFAHKEDNQMRDFVVPILERRKVQLAIGGHNHCYERVNPINGVHYLTTGAGGRALYSLRIRAGYSAVYNNTQFSFAGFEVQGNQMIVRSLTGSGDLLDAFQLDLDHPFEMDGRRDPVAKDVNGAYAALTGSTLYLAFPDLSSTVRTSHLYISSSTNMMASAPDGKLAQILAPDLVLTADHQYGAHAWQTALPITNTLSALHTSRTAFPTRGAHVVEGTIDLQAAFGGVPKKLYIARALYSGNTLVEQWPPPPSLDATIAADEYYVLDLSTIATDFPVANQTNTHYVAKGDTIRIGMDPAFPDANYTWQQVSGQPVAFDPSTNAFSFTYDDASPFEQTFVFSYAVHDPRFQGTNIQRVVFVPADDTDNDGLLDYEEINGLNVISTPFDPEGQITLPDEPDSDFDGVSDSDEVYAGTGANDPASRFDLLKPRPLSNFGVETVYLDWHSQPERRYRLLRAEQAAGPWITVADDLPATPPMNTHLDLYLINRIQYVYKVQVLHD
jgi:acid phosphatase type 7